MGYYSDFDITDYDGDQDILRDILNSQTDYHWDVYSDDSGIYLGSAKWYRWQEDLDRIAKSYDMSFSVVRYGEDSPDITRIVVTPGQTRLEQAIISWPT